MGYFDDIIPPDGASSYVATPPGVPRITVRPKGVEPTPAPPQFDDVGLARHALSFAHLLAQIFRRDRHAERGDRVCGDYLEWKSL